MNPAVPSKKVRVGPLAVALMIHALQEAPQTYEELSTACGLHHTTLRRWLPAFRLKRKGLDRLVYISEWREDKNGRRNTPAFSWGALTDAKSVPVSDTERKAKYRQRARRAKQNSILFALANVPVPQPQGEMNAYLHLTRK